MLTEHLIPDLAKEVLGYLHNQQHEDLFNELLLPTRKCLLCFRPDTEYSQVELENSTYRYHGRLCSVCAQISNKQLLTRFDFNEPSLAFSVTCRVLDIKQDSSWSENEILLFREYHYDSQPYQPRILPTSRLTCELKVQGKFLAVNNLHPYLNSSIMRLRSS